MGYTHYWHYNPDKMDAIVWRSAIVDCEKILAFCHVAAVEPDWHDDNWFGFNGIGEDAYETFSVPRTLSTMLLAIKDKRANMSSFGPKYASRQARFDFCKTARMPYDLVVTACLCVLAEAGLEVSSDGDADEWTPGAQFATKALLRPVSIPPKVLHDEDAL